MNSLIKKHKFKESVARIPCIVVFYKLALWLIELRHLRKRRTCFAPLGIDMAKVQATPTP